MTRVLTSHKVNPLNDKIMIEVLDEPGAGGANHEYRVALPNGTETYIVFQNGPIGDKGINGLTQEVLLAIVQDRLQSFQAGPYACRDNDMALSAVETGMLWLHKRTLDRMQRNVEGTMQK